jgi:hypothetical protein
MPLASINSYFSVRPGGGDLSEFYPRSNPSGFITSSQTGAFYAASNPSGFITGDLSTLYPRSNPSGFITGVNLSNYVTSSQTGAFYAASNPSGFITGDLSTLYPRSNPSGFITGVNLSNYVTSSQTGAFYAASNPSGFITGDLSTLYPRSNPSGFITGDLSALYPRTNPSGYITGNLSNYATASHSHLATDITGGVLNNARTTATSSNTVSSIVARDANGDFSARQISSSLIVPKTSSLTFNDSFGSDFIISGGVDDKLFIRQGGANILEIDSVNGYPIWKFKDDLGSNTKIGIFTDSPLTEFHVNGTITANALSAPIATIAASGLMSANDKVLLNSAVLVSGNQQISGTKIFVNPPLETKASPAISAGALTLNLTSASLFYVNLNAAITTFTLQNVPASPSVHSFTLQFIGDGTARTVTWPVGTRWAGGTNPTITSTLNKVDTFTFMTHDGGTNWFAFVSSQNQ